MANTLAVAFDIDTPAATMEISIDSGVTWAGLTVPAAGTHKTGNLLNVPAATYNVGVIQLRAVSFPSSVVKNLAQVIITAAATTPGPTITAVSPSSGAVGATVTVTGTNLTGATALSFNGVAASFTVVSATSVNTTVPTGATAGTIAITTPGGTATSPSSFTITAAGAKSGWNIVHVGDSLAAYPGATDGSTPSATSAGAQATARIQRAGRTEVITRHGYPGWNASQFLTATTQNTNQYATQKPAGQTALTFAESLIDPTKYNLFIVGFGTNVNPAGTDAADIQSIHSQLKSAGADYTIQQLLLPTKSVIPNRAGLNAGFISGSGVWNNGYTHENELPQMFSDDAFDNSSYFGNPDFLGYFGVHKTSLGNKVGPGEYMAREIARVISFALPNEIVPTAITAENVENDSNRVLYGSPASWSAYTQSSSYSNGSGAVSSLDAASYGIVFLGAGIRVYTPQTTAGASITLTITSAAGAVLATKTGTQLGNSGSTVLIEVTGLPAGAKTATVSHTAGTATGTPLYADVFGLADANGVFAVGPVATQLISWTADTGIVASNGNNRLVKTSTVTAHDNLSVGSFAIRTPTSTTVAAGEMSIPLPLTASGIVILQGLAYAASIPAAGSRSYANANFILFVNETAFDVYGKDASGTATHFSGGPLSHGGVFLKMKAFSDRIEITSSSASFTITQAVTGNLIPVVEINTGSGTTQGATVTNINLIASGF